MGLLLSICFFFLDICCDLVQFVSLLRMKFCKKLSCRLKLQRSFNNFLLDVNFNKSTIRLYIYIFFISSMLEKFQEDKKIKAMSSIKCLNFDFLYSKKGCITCFFGASNTLFNYSWSCTIVQT